MPDTPLENHARGGSPDRYAVIGNPVEHSRSPDIHAAFAASTNQHLEYTRIEAPVDGFAAAADAFRRSGGRGLNVTVPFKLDAHAYATACSEAARMAGAVNALRFDGDRIEGENFDGSGLVRDVLENLRIALDGRRILVLGAGGAARGLLLPLLATAPAAITIANLDESVARALAELAAPQAGGARVAGCDYRALAGLRFDLVFNATSASLSGQLPPVPATAFVGCKLAYDLAYGKGTTPFLRLARNAGAALAVDGVGMLAEQAAEAFAWWRGVRPRTKDLIERMRSSA